MHAMHPAGYNLRHYREDAQNSLNTTHPMLAAGDGTSAAPVLVAFWPSLYPHPPERRSQGCFHDRTINLLTHHFELIHRYALVGNAHISLMGTQMPRMNKTAQITKSIFDIQGRIKQPHIQNEWKTPLHIKVSQSVHTPEHPLSGQLSQGRERKVGHL
jgi:hypothetical protein